MIRTTLTPTLSETLAEMFRALAARGRPARPSGPEETEAERCAWVQEVLCSSPEAFGSELDVQALMSDGLHGP